MIDRYQRLASIVERTRSRIELDLRHGIGFECDHGRIECLGERLPALGRVIALAQQLCSTNRGLERAAIQAGLLKLGQRALESHDLFIQVLLRDLGKIDLLGGIEYLSELHPCIPIVVALLTRLRLGEDGIERSSVDAHHGSEEGLLGGGKSLLRLGELGHVPRGGILGLHRDVAGGSERIDRRLRVLTLELARNGVLEQRVHRVDGDLQARGGVQLAKCAGKRALELLGRGVDLGLRHLVRIGNLLGLGDGSIQRVRGSTLVVGTQGRAGRTGVVDGDIERHSVDRHAAGTEERRQRLGELGVPLGNLARVHTRIERLLSLVDHGPERIGGLLGVVAREFADSAVAEGGAHGCELVAERRRRVDRIE